MNTPTLTLDERVAIEIYDVKESFAARSTDYTKEEVNDKINAAVDATAEIFHSALKQRNDVLREVGSIIKSMQGAQHDEFGEDIYDDTESLDAIDIKCNTALSIIENALKE